MIKDIITVVTLIFLGLLSKIVEWLDGDEEQQILGYELGITLIILTLAIHILTEVKGNRVYIWLGLVFLAAMNPINLLFNDLKIDIWFILASYITAGVGVFLYRKYK